MRCGQVDKSYFDCNADSYLFLEDNYYWDLNHDPDIVDASLLREMISAAFNMTEAWICVFQEKNLDCMIKVFQSISVDRMERNEYFPTDNAVNRTLTYIWEKTDGGDPRKIVEYLYSSRYVLVNLTTLSLSHNRWSNSDLQRESRLCIDIQNYLNNLATFELSGAVFGFVPCRRISGFPYLTNITCNDCEISGWFPDLFSGLPIKHLHFARATGLGSVIRDDINGDVFGSAPGLEVLDISGLKDGIMYFSNAQILTSHPYLSTLNVANNLLSSWNVTIESNPNLQTLDLQNNDIKTIPPQFRNEIDLQYHKTGLKLFLQRNLVNCRDKAYV